MCLRSHLIPSGYRYRIAVVVQARYSRPSAPAEEAGPVLSCGRSAKLMMGEEGQSRKSACRAEQEKEPLQRRCS